MVVNGNKRWIGNGNRDLLIVYGNLAAEKRVVGAIVEVATEGVRSEKI
jgi:acyl-CoA oxidase